MAQDANQRNRVAQLAKSDWKAARNLAVGIGDAWNRTQAIAWVARFSPPVETVRLARRSFDEAQHCADAYKRLACVAWPLRALVETGHDDQAKVQLKRIIGLAGDVEPEASRAEALLLLFQAVWPLGDSVARTVVDKLVSSCGATRSWRSLRALRTVALIYNGSHPDLAVAIANSIPIEAKRRTTLKRVRAGEVHPVRPFFW